MTQRIVTINNTQFVSGTELMAHGEGGDHTRLLWASVPPFAARPDVTVSIYSAETGNPFYPLTASASSGTSFTPWSIEYVPGGGANGADLIAISAANTETGVASDATVVCSYLAIGDQSKGADI